MSTLISFIQEEPKHYSKKSAQPSKFQAHSEVEIKAPSIPSNRERIINVFNFKKVFHNN